MSLIEISNLTFAYPGSYDDVFENVSLRLDTDWKLGLVGRNGRGKTTLMRLLMGEYEYKGRISANVRFNYFPYKVDDPDISPIDILEAMSPEGETWRAIKEASLLGLEEDSLYRPYSTLSGGEQVRVLLAGLFLSDDGFPLIDEPTNHLDMEGREQVGRYLRGKRGFILVSHDRVFLDSCIDHVMSINRQDIEVRQGNFSQWWRDKEDRDQWELEENQRLKKEIGRLDAAARRASAWADKTEAGKKGSRNSGLRPDRGYIGHKSAKMMSRAKSVEARRQEAAEQKSGLLRNIESTEPLKLRPLQYVKPRILEARDLAPDYGQGIVCAPVTFEIMRGETVALTGRNGTGKSSVLKMVLGDDIGRRGSLSVGSGITISYVPQDMWGLSGSIRDFVRESGIDDMLFRTILRKLDFSRAQFEKDMSEYSAGQKKKVLLARSLCESAHLYIWDEPLNYIDIFSRMQIQRLLEEYRPTILMVEHDRAFVEALADKVIELEPPIAF